MIKDWTTLFPQNLDSYTQMPTLVDSTDETRVSQMHAVRNAVIQLETQVGSNSLESGSLRSVISNLKSFNVKDYGAVGNGIANDGAAINNTITAAKAASNGAAIYFPTGNYKCSSPYTFSLTHTKPLYIYGDGYSSNIIFNGVTDQAGFSATDGKELFIQDLRLSGQNSWGLYITRTTTLNPHKVKIINCDISCAKINPVPDTQIPLAAIYTYGIDDLLIERCNIHDCGDPDGYAAAGSTGITCDYYTDAYGARIIGNKIDGNNDKLDFGILTYNQSNMEISGNIITDIGGVFSEPPPTGYAIMCYRTAIFGPHYAAKCRVTNNYIKHVNSNGVYLQSCPYSVIADNIFEDVARVMTNATLLVSGISANAGHTTITGNIIKGSGRCGIQTQGSFNTITGNIIENVREDGITLRDDVSDGIALADYTNEGTVVSGNTINGAGFYGINITNIGKSVRIVNNTVKNTGVGIIAQGGFNDSVVSGNIIDTSVASGIIEYDGYRSSIIDNNITSTADYAIALVGMGTQFNIVSGNTIVGTRGIKEYKGVRNMITHNDLYNISLTPILQISSPTTKVWNNMMPTGQVLDVGLIPDMATLRTQTGSANQTVLLDGYYAAGDGGGGTFVWSSVAAADDGGTIINLGGGSAAGWRRIYSGGLDVRWFGAKGDGVHNNAPNIQAALNTAAINGGGEVYIPTGVYRVNSTLTFGSYTKIIGAGRYATNIIMYGDNVIFKATATPRSFVYISDMAIYNNNATPVVGRIGVSFDGVNFASIERCLVSYNYKGVQTGDTALAGGGQYAFINDCEVTGNVYGVYFEQVSNAGRLIGGRIYANSNTGAYCAGGSAGIYIQSTFESPGGTQPYGVRVASGTTEVVITNTYFEGHTSRGILFENGSYSNREHDNIYGGTILDYPRDEDGRNLTLPFVPSNIKTTDGYALVWNTADAYWTSSHIIDGITVGLPPTGITNDKGISTTNTSNILSLWGTRSSGSGNVSVAAVADINNATIDPNHKVFQIGWVNDVNSFTELFSFKDGEFDIATAANAKLLSDDVDGASVTAVTLGSANSFTTSGAKLLSVVNGSPSGYERAAVDYQGNLLINRLDNNQSFEIRSLTEEVTIQATADSYSSIQIPQYAVVMAVSSRVTNIIPTATTIKIGVSGDAARYAYGVGTGVGAVSSGTQDTTRYYAIPMAICITPNSTPAAATGKVRITIHYYMVNTPTS